MKSLDNCLSAVQDPIAVQQPINDNHVKCNPFKCRSNQEDAKKNGLLVNPLSTKCPIMDFFFKSFGTLQQLDVQK